MAKAVKKHTPRKSGRSSRSNPSKAAPLKLVRLEDVYRQLRDQGLEPNEVVQRMTALLRQWPSWIRRTGFRGKIGHVSFRGKITWELLPVAFWQNEEDILSVGMDATGADCLVINFTPYSHPSVSYERPQFFMRAEDIGREVHLDEGGDNVISDYHPFAEFQREVEGRPRPLTRLPPAPEAPTPNKKPTPTSASKKKRRKVKSAPIKARRRGPKAKILPRIIGAMKNDISEGRLTVDVLEAMPDKELEDRYPAKRERVRAARQSIIEELKK